LKKETCLEKIKEETDKHPDMQDWEEAESQADGASTRPISSAGTPQPKINLKFNKTKSVAARTGADTGSQSQAQSDSE